MVEEGRQSFTLESRPCQTLPHRQCYLWTTSTYPLSTSVLLPLILQRYQMLFTALLLQLQCLQPFDVHTDLAAIAARSVTTPAPDAPAQRPCRHRRLLSGCYARRHRRQREGGVRCPRPLLGSVTRPDRSRLASQLRGALVGPPFSGTTVMGRLAGRQPTAG